MNKILLPIAATAAAAGGAAALWLGPAFAGAQTSGPTTTTAPAATASPTKGPLETALDKLVADGTLTQAQADKVAAALKEALPGRGFEMHGRFGGPGGGVGFGVTLDAAAGYLGITEPALRTELEGGKTLAQVATAKGKTVSGLVSALVTDADTRIDAAATAGKLTAAEATKIKADLNARITEMVNNTAPKGPFGGGFRHHLDDDDTTTTTPSAA